MKPKLLLLLLICLGICKAKANNFVVTSNADSGPGTLREALQLAAANGTATTDNITFNIPYTDTASITIGILTSLPDVTANVTIDGTTEPSPKLGVSDSKIIIEPFGGVNGINSSVMINYCMRLANADNAEIYGLCIRHFNDYADLNSLEQEPFGVFLSNSKNVIFGAPGKGNVIAGCPYGLGCFYFAGNSKNLTVQSSFFGVDADGKTVVAPNIFFNNINGVVLTTCSNATIGGNTPAMGNLFSGNASELGFAEDSGKIDIGNNKFNTDYTGNNELLNPEEEEDVSSSNSPADFYIHDNVMNGESDFEDMSGRFLIIRNFFGVNPSQTRNFSNGILDFQRCTGEAMIGGADSTKNIFGNGVLGVGNDNSTKITVLHNSFYCHEDGGIYMNWYTLPNKPFVTVNKFSATSVEGMARPGSIIELFYTDTCRFCEGKTFIARFNADNSGAWKYTGAINGGITATATNIDDSTTSAFAVPEMDASQVIIKNATCDKSNGSITNLKITSGTTFYWIDGNDNIISTDTSLINVKSGSYQLVCGIGNNTCKVYSPTFTIGNTIPPIIDSNSFKIVQPACGSHGNIQYTGYVDNTNLASWLSEQGITIQQGIQLQNALPGKYYFKIAVADDTSCNSIYGPIQLTSQSGPTLQTNQIAISNATCGKTNGSIKGITYTNVTGTPYIAWQDSTGKVINNNIDLTGIGKGKYRLLFKDASSCDTIITPYYIIADTGTISINENNISVKPSSCRGSDGSITGITSTGATVYTWSNTSTGNVVGNSLDLNNVPAGTYQLNLGNSFGCTDQTKIVKVDPANFLAIAVQDVSVKDASCNLDNGSIAISKFSANPLLYTLRWTDSATNKVIGDNTLLNKLAQGTYILNATDSNGCSQNIYSGYIIQAGIPAFDYGSLLVNSDTCNSGSGSVINLLTKDPPGGIARTYTWQWFNGQQQIGNAPNNLYSLQQGNYYATITDQNNCSVSSNTFAINNVETIPASPFANDLYIPRNTSATITVANPQKGTYELLNDDVPGTIPSASSQNGIFQTPVITEDRSYYIRFINGDCKSSLAKVNIKVFDSTILFIPSGFTPNKDGINDQFHVTVKGLINRYSISIYNRWGSLVYQSNNPSGSWDGNLKGLPVPQGVYVFIITAIDYRNRAINQKGIITLLR